MGELIGIYATFPDLSRFKIATTQIYAKVIERKVSDDMGSLRSVLKSKDAVKNTKYVI